MDDALVDDLGHFIAGNVGVGRRSMVVVARDDAVMVGSLDAGVEGAGRWYTAARKFIHKKGI